MKPQHCHAGRSRVQAPRSILHVCPLAGLLALLLAPAVVHSQATDPLDTWRLRVSAGTIRGLTHGDGLFVARDYGTNAYLSTNGAHWIIRATGTNASPPFAPYSAAHGNGRYVFCGNNGFAVTTNGLDWDYAKPHGYFWGWEVLHVDGLFVAAGFTREYPQYDSAVLTSVDGLNWNTRLTLTNAMLRGLGYGGGVWVAVGERYPAAAGEPTRISATSLDTASWRVSHDYSSNAPLQEISHGHGVFIGQGLGLNVGTLITNGPIPTVRWSQLLTADQWPAHNILETKFFSGRFFACGSGYFASSLDATNWTRHDPGQTGTLLAIGYGNDRVLVGGNGISQSAPLVPGPPLIVEPPRDVLMRSGNTYINRVVAEGTSLAFQWQVNGIDLPGATNASVVISNAPASLSGAHTVVAWTVHGSVTSSVANVMVANPSSISQQPVSQSIAPGGNVTLSVRAEGTPPFAFRWRRNGLTYAYSFADEPVSFLTISNVVGNALFSVVVSNLVDSPGRLSDTAQITVQPDIDGDGLPDEFELRNGLSPASAADAALDSDGDGISNLDEYRAGTDPGNASSFLRVSRVSTAAGARIQFNSSAGKTYTVQYTDDLASPTWHRLADVAALPNDSATSIADPGASNTRFYRIVTPRAE